MNRTVLIPAAGLGSRLGEFSKNYSKAMLTLGTRPAFSYVFETFDKDDEFIVLLGYKGELLKECIKAYYPDYNITFVNVDKFEGPGSGLGYSILQAKDLLQKPFFFHSCDTLYTDSGIPLMQRTIRRIDLSKNYVFCADSENDGAEYRFVDFEKNCECTTTYDFGDTWSFSARAVRILPKDCDRSQMFSKNAPYIGVAYIKDYKKFWEVADKPEFIEVGESLGINNLDSLYAIRLNGNVWVDSGNKAIYTKYKNLYQKRSDVVILPKPDEGIWIKDDRVIKFHCDSDFIAKRVEKAQCLVNVHQKGIRVPKIIAHSAHTYTYELAEGKVMSKIVTPALLYELLTRYTANSKEVIIFKDDKDFPKRFYEKFYKDKTLSRIKKFLATNEMTERTVKINGLECRPAIDLVGDIHFDKWANSASFSKEVHGDFHLENVLYNEKNDEFILLDWRQGFLNEGKDTDFIGDIYYDIGKMYHSFIVNHQMVQQGHLSVEEKTDEVRIDIHTTFMDNECFKMLDSFIGGRGSHAHAKLITSLIFLNICACHEAPYCVFLYYLGRYLLQQWANKLFQR